MKRFKLPALALAALMALTAMPANAQVTAYAPGQGAVNRIEVGIDVRASVRGKCGFAASGTPAGVIDQPKFDRSGLSRDFAIHLNCTTASRIAVSSMNGGLTHDEAVPGYASRAPYDVELFMVGDNGTTAGATCGATSLTTAGECSFAGKASAANGLLLNAASTRANGSYLRVSAPPYTGGEPLLAGEYSDILTITIAIAP